MDLLDKNTRFEGGMVETITDINQRRRIDWAERGLVVPEIEETTGRGNRRVYSYWNLLQIEIIKNLMRKGLTQNTIWKILAHLDSYRERRESKSLTKMLLEDSKWVNSFPEIREEYQGKVRERINEIFVEEDIFNKRFPHMEIIGLFFSSTQDQLFICGFGEEFNKFLKGNDEMLKGSFEENIRNSELVLFINFRRIKDKIDQKLKTLGLEKERL